MKNRLLTFNEFLFEAEAISSEGGGGEFLASFRAGSSETPISKGLADEMGIKVGKMYEISLKGGLNSLINLFKGEEKVQDFASGKFKESGDSKEDYLEIADKKITGKGEIFLNKSDSKPGMIIKASGNGILTLARFAVSLQIFKEKYGKFVSDLTDYDITFSLGTPKSEEKSRGWGFYAYDPGPDSRSQLQQGIGNPIQLAMLFGSAAQQTDLKEMEKIFAPVFKGTDQTVGAYQSAIIKYTRDNFKDVQSKGPMAYQNIIKEKLNIIKDGFIKDFYYVASGQLDFGKAYADAISGKDSKSMFKLVDQRSADKSDPQFKSNKRAYLFEEGGKGIFVSKQGAVAMEEAQKKCAELLKTDQIPAGMDAKSSGILKKISNSTVSAAKGTDKLIGEKESGYLADLAQGKFEPGKSNPLGQAQARSASKANKEGEFRMSGRQKTIING